MVEAALQTSARQAIITDLNREVANALALYLNYKKYHWQVSGPLFRDLHLLFDQHAGEVLATVDELGERVRILSGLAVHHPSQIADAASVRLSEPGRQSPRQMVEEALANHLKVIQGMRISISAAAKDDDPATADLLTRFIQVHDKQAWFLREILAGNVNILD